MFLYRYPFLVWCYSFSVCLQNWFRMIFLNFVSANAEIYHVTMVNKKKISSNETISKSQYFRFCIRMFACNIISYISKAFMHMILIGTLWCWLLVFACSLELNECVYKMPMNLDSVWYYCHVYRMPNIFVCHTMGSGAVAVCNVMAMIRRRIFLFMAGCISHLFYIQFLVLYSTIFHLKSFCFFYTRHALVYAAMRVCIYNI